MLYGEEGTPTERESLLRQRQGRLVQITTKNFPEVEVNSPTTRFIGLKFKEGNVLVDIANKTIKIFDERAYKQAVKLMRAYNFFKDESEFEIVRDYEEDDS